VTSQRRRISLVLAGLALTSALGTGFAYAATAPTGSLVNGTTCGTWQWLTPYLAVASCIYRSGTTVRGVTEVYNATNSTVTFRSDQKIAQHEKFGTQDTFSDSESTYMYAYPGAYPDPGRYTFCYSSLVDTRIVNTNRIDPASAIATINVYTPWGTYANVHSESPYV
jgi:hypothetical protein